MFERGDKVMTTEDLGGGFFSRYYVPKGAFGVVISADSWGRPAQAIFDTRDGRVEADIDDDVAQIVD